MGDAKRERERSNTTPKDLVAGLGAMNPNKRPPPSSSGGTFEGGDATKRSREAILRPGKDTPGNVLLLRITDIVHPVSLVPGQKGEKDQDLGLRERERERTGGGGGVSAGRA